jgi:hypothetical protein
MPSPYPPTPTELPTTVDLPDDGDLEDASSVNVAFEASLDAIANLELPSKTGTPYPFPATGVSLTRMQRQPAIVDRSEWFQIPFLDVWIAIPATPVQLVVPILFPLQCEVTDVIFYVSAGGGHSSLPGPGDRPTLILYEYDPVTQTSTPLTVSVEDPQSGTTIAAYEAPHAFPLSLSGVFPDPISKKYFATLTTEGGPNAQTGYRFDACQTSVTIVVQDPE